MYAKRRAKTEEKKEPPKQRAILYIVIGAAIILIVGIGWFAYSYLKGRILPTDLTKECARTLESRTEGNLLVVLCVKKDGDLFLIWKNLPVETTSINIYRTDASGGAPSLWKTVTVTGENGSLNIGSEGDSQGYAFGFEAADTSGNVKWSSPNTPSSPPGGTPGSGTGATSSGSGQGQTGTPPNQTPPTSNPVTSQPPTPTSSQTSTPPPSNTLPPTPTSTPSGYDTSTYVYYTPSGQVSGTSSIPTANFWVKHVNKIIEIGWQNIASSTNRIIIYRSKIETGDYGQLFVQENPVVNGSDFIRLDDHTINESYYYKMEAKNNSTVLATYGPVLLPALGQ